MKTKTITLTAGWLHKDDKPGSNVTGYRVEQITDSLEFAPGNVINRAEAERLCDSAMWKVTIKQNVRT